MRSKPSKEERLFRRGIREGWEIVSDENGVHVVPLRPLGSGPTPTHCTYLYPSMYSFPAGFPGGTTATGERYERRND